MAHNLPLIAAALGPIFAMIVLGYLMRRGGFPGEAFWPEAERLTYYLLFPALLVDKLARADLGQYAIAPLAGVIVAALLVATAALFLLRPRLGVGGPAFGSIYQGSIRFNTYVGLAAALAVFEHPGATVAALAIAVLIPLVNVLCVSVLAHARGDVTASLLLRALVRNPLILACALGITLNASGVGLVPGTVAVVDILARAALPVGLLAMGAGLRLRVAYTQRREIAAATVMKLLLMPALVLALCRVAGLAPLETGVLVLFAALPGAPSSYILARQMGGDATLMAAIVTVETALSVLTLPPILLLVL